MKRITLFISALVLIGVGAIAQGNKVVGSQQNIYPNDAPPTRTCATMDINSAEALELLEENLAPQIAAYIQSRNLGNNPEAIYTIPTVVHVIHNSNEAVGSGRNIPNARIQEQMTILNDDFRRTNQDAVNTPSYFVGVAADCEINFCLITKYPSGHPQAGQTMPEPGVDRVSTTQLTGVSNTTSGYSTSTINNSIKPQTSWNPNEVMNIWVCQLQSGLLGYATFPNSGPANQDGTVMGYQYFGLTGGPYGLGRTTTHEVGHWLGCYHIWGDDNGACSGSDQCADTPNQANSTGGCPSGVRTDACTGGNGIMYQNYMDYSNDACMNIFTQDQKARMQSVMASQPRRSTLNGFSTTLCSATALTASFTESATVINAGQTITFTDQSTGPNAITTWNWDFDVTNNGGVSPATASTQGAHVVTFSTPGTYTVSLQVGDGVSTDTQTKNAYISVLAVGTSICDTVTNMTGTDALYGSGGWGWISGHNDYDDRGKADYFSSAPPAGYQLSGVEMLFGKAHDGTGSSTINVTVWDNTGAGGAPGSILHTQSVAISALNLYPTPTFVALSTPVSVSTPYYVGIQFNANTNNSQQDSIALITNQDGQTNPGTAWELWNDASWHNYNENPASWGLNMSNAIWVEMCNNLTTGVDQEVVSSAVTVFPNPAKDVIRVILPNKENAQIVVFNMVGEVVYSNNSLPSTNMTIDMSNQANGMYFVKVKTTNQTITKKILLAK